MHTTITIYLSLYLIYNKNNISNRGNVRGYYKNVHLIQEFTNLINYYRLAKKIRANKTIQINKFIKKTYAILSLKVFLCIA